eukprot:TRINITY_DN8403_c0_g1_i1.p1 TRINITY_DN8403_c0_g1~~TRINITY_DN8403_c0_g1_i1.p1  ORF type:complete len:514 (+),score=64.37 TRINITY_DN8403_c0_g1_i1:49-1590(+)
MIRRTTLFCSLLVASLVILSAQGADVTLVEILVKNKSTEGINEPLRLCLTFTNEHDSLIENAIISFSGGQYFSKHVKLEPLPPGVKTDTCFELIPRLPRATFMDIPPKLHITIQMEDGRVISELQHEFTFVDFAGKLKTYKPRNSDALYRILAVGIQGAGKSSFINSAFAMMYGNPAVQGSAAGYGTEATTRVVREFHLPNTSVALIDTWGLNNENIATFPIELLIEGNYDKLNMEGKNTATKRTSPDLRFHKAHAILFFLDYEMINEQNIEGFFKDAWRKVSIAAEEKGVPLLIVITKLDNVDKNLLTNPSLPVISEKHTNLLVARGIHANLISHVLVYHGERRTSNWNIDRSVYDVLDTVLAFAHLVQPAKSTRYAECVTFWRSLRLSQGYSAIVDVVFLPSNQGYLGGILVFCTIALTAIWLVFQWFLHTVIYGLLGKCCSKQRPAQAAAQNAAAAGAPVWNAIGVSRRQFRIRETIVYSFFITVAAIIAFPFVPDRGIVAVCEQTYHLL